MFSRKPHIVGRPFPRIEGQLKLTGASRYVDDLPFGDELLHARLVRSTRPHARILKVDSRAARAVPGVRLVLTGADLAARMGVNLRDRPVLARDRVRYAGEPLAVVVAETPESAELAARLVAVSYQDLPGVFSAAEAMATDAVLLHPELEAYERLPFVVCQPGTNIAHHSQVAYGDLDQAWSGASVVIEGEYWVPPVQHVSMEPHGAVAQVDRQGRINLWAATQSPFVQRQSIAEALALDPQSLRVITPFVGGGFGGKALASIEAIAVAAALALPGRPVKLVLNREEEFTSTFTRPGLTARIKAGADNDGCLLGLQAAYFWDCGASADACTETAWLAAYAGTGPYDIPHVHIDSYAVYTNHPAAGPMRGNGMAELHWAVEQHIDRLAAAISCDPVEFRLQNCVKGGDALFGGQVVMHTTGLDQCIRQAAEALNWRGDEKGKKLGGKLQAADNLKRGKGLAAMWKPVFSLHQPEVRAQVRLDARDLCTVELGTVDMGQGLHTVAAQLVASELGVPLEWVRFSPLDTDQSPEQWQAMDSHLTWSLGNAVLGAAQAARSEVLAAVARAWGESISHLDIVEGTILSHASNRTLGLDEILAGVDIPAPGNPSAVVHLAGPFVGQGRFMPVASASLRGEPDAFPLPVMHFSTGAQAVEVWVDEETGAVDVVQVAAAFDVGHAINPNIVEAQIKGGAVQGLSTTLWEQMAFAEGHLLNPNLRDYRIATSLDIPERLHPIIVEVPQDDGPYGARGIGEHSLIPTAAAVANAIARAVGVRVTSLPISSQKVWEVLHAQTPTEG